VSLPKASDLRGLSGLELKQKRDSLERELHDLRQKRVTGQLEKPHFFKLVRRQIAQINTVEREKETGKEPAAKAPAKAKTVKAAKKDTKETKKTTKKTGKSK